MDLGLSLMNAKYSFSQTAHALLYHVKQVRKDFADPAMFSWDFFFHLKILSINRPIF